MGLDYKMTADLLSTGYILIYLSSVLWINT